MKTQAWAVTRVATRLALTPAYWGGRVAVGVLRVGVRRSATMPERSDAERGVVVDLPGRGEVFVIDTGAPHGRPDAPTLLLFHGIATTAHLCWFGVLDDLRRHYRVVMFDQRWHGRGIVSERFDLDDCADDAAALLDVLGVGEATVVGYSMGGALAQVFAHGHPSRTAGLVLCSTSAAWVGNRLESGFYPVLGLASTRLAPGVRARLAERATGPDAEPVEPVAEAGPTSMSSWAWAEFRRTSMWSLPEVLAVLGRFDSRAWLPDVDVPAAVVVTATDRAIPAARQRALAALLPHARVFEAPGGHTSIAFDTDRWRPLFLDAVADVTGRAAATRVGV